MGHLDSSTVCFSMHPTGCYDLPTCLPSLHVTVGLAFSATGEAGPVHNMSTPGFPPNLLVADDAWSSPSGR